MPDFVPWIWISRIQPDPARSIKFGRFKMVQAPKMWVRPTTFNCVTKLGEPNLDESDKSMINDVHRRGS